MGGAPGVDASPPRSQMCDSSWSLAPPEALAGIASGHSVGQARLSLDETEMFFSRQLADGHWHIFRAVRRDADAAFEPEVMLAALDVDDTSSYFPALSGDGLTLSFSRFGSNQPQETFDARRTTRTSEFSRPVLVESNSALLFRVPGEPEYFLSRSDAGLLAMVEVTPTENRFVFAERLGNDYPYWYEPQAKMLWFFRSSLMTAVRTGQGWSKPVDAADSGVAIQVSWVSPDGCRLYGGEDPKLPAGSLQLQRRLPPSR